MITVLMATRNRAASLERVLESYTLLLAPREGWEAIIVDNGSTDSTADVVRAFASSLPLTYLSEPRPGRSLAVNAGLDRAAGDLILFSDDNVLPPVHWLVDYAVAAASHAGFDLFAGPVCPEWPFEPPSWAVRNERVRVVCFMETDPARAAGPTMGWLAGGNLAIRRSVLALGARFDSGWGPRPGGYAMGGDMELVRRLRRHGHKAWWVADAAVRHLIRPGQLTQKWALGRAVEFGRGQYGLADEYTNPAPKVAGVPRWILRHAAERAGRVVAAWIRRDRLGLFEARWDLNFYCGVVAGAWRARTASPHGRPTASPHGDEQ